MLRGRAAGDGSMHLSFLRSDLGPGSQGVSLRARWGLIGESGGNILSTLLWSSSRFLYNCLYLLRVCNRVWQDLCVQS